MEATDTVKVHILILYYYTGGGQGGIDKCERDDIEMEDGTCQSLLTKGNCNVDEEVLLDPETNRVIIIIVFFIYKNLRYCFY